VPEGKLWSRYGSISPLIKMFFVERRSFPDYGYLWLIDLGHDVVEVSHKDSTMSEIEGVTHIRILERGEEMLLNITIELWQKSAWYIAKSPELDFVSQGKTREEAKKNLIEVIHIQFHEMQEMGTLHEYLAECGFELKNDTIFPKNEMIGFERYSLEVA
jgi:predicted RNase H-like HicB family nuclease